MAHSLPKDSVRGRIRAYLERQSHLFGDNVLEIGSRMTNAESWWINNRDLQKKGNWTGIDMQQGNGVDFVADIHNLPEDWSGRFSSVLCSEVMEHVARPWLALPELKRVIKPGGHIIITTLFSFPEHGFPDDYYRYSCSGLSLLLKDAGFVDIVPEYAGVQPILLNDHGEPGFCKRNIPQHVFAVARVP